MAKERNDNQDIHYVTWKQYDSMLYQLSHKLEKLPTGIQLYGIPRGGIHIALDLNYILKDTIFIMSIPSIPPDQKHDNILILDDIVDSGDTIVKYSNSFKTASLFYRYNSVYEPDYYVEEIYNDDWIQFPWERDLGAI